MKVLSFKDVMPKGRRLFLENFAAVKGIQMYESFRSGELQYWYFAFEPSDQFPLAKACDAALEQEHGSFQHILAAMPTVARTR